MQIKPTLCCLFKSEPIKFRTFTLKSLKYLSLKQKAEKIMNIYAYNIETLQSALDKCLELNIQSYRISSDLLPKFSYVQENNLLPQGYYLYIEAELRNIKSHDIILSIHPSQFVVMNSLKQDVIYNSVKELKYHLYLADLLGIDSINFHVGGIFSDKELSTKRFIDNMNTYFSRDELDKFTLENDEKSYTILDVLNICKQLDIRPTFDIHHEKCYAINKYSIYHEINFDIQNKLNLCKYIWINKGFSYMQVHLSSPRDDRYLTLKGSSPHSDFIHKEDMIDFSFLDFDVVVDIEAKSKELAVHEYLKFN